MSLNHSLPEADQRLAVLQQLLKDIEAGTRILLPEFSGDEKNRSEFALLSVGIEPNPYGGTVGAFRYQFEGEDDLLHLMICRQDEEPFPAADAQAVVLWLLTRVEPGLVWIKPGERSHHFYLGHDHLLELDLLS
jgi:hypothetical protein